MSTQPAPANLHTKPGPHGPARPAADAQYYRHILHDLIDMGAGLASLLHQQATAQAAQRTIPAAQQASAPQPTPASAPNALIPDTLISIAAAFDRITRAVRRSIALARSLAGPVPPASDPAQHRAAARRRILREVEDTIQRTAPGSGHTVSGDASFKDVDSEDASAEALTTELHDRLDAPDLDDDLTTRPVADIITEICCDLGLAALSGAHPWKRRTPADLKQLCARAAAPSDARQPSAGLHSMPMTQRAPTNPVPPEQAAIPRATGPVRTRSSLPDEPVETPAKSPAETTATIPRHPAHPRGQWHPPPEPRQTLEGPHR